MNTWPKIIEWAGPSGVEVLFYEEQLTNSKAIYCSEDGQYKICFLKQRDGSLREVRER